jgi:hypothetical protein
MTELATLDLPPLPLVEKPAIETAREYYASYGGSAGTFNRELAEYAENAMVFIRPDLFLMAKIIDLGNGPIWYIRMAVGVLSELVQTLPVYLPEVCFTRHGDLRLRTYSLDRIARYVAHKRRKNHG